MRLLAPLVMMLAIGCGNPFEDAQKLDTVDAYEKFLTEHPSSPFVTQAEIRVEELMLEKARADQTLESYDAVIKRFPEGKGQLYHKAWEERREVLYKWADETDTPEAWHKYLDEYPSGDKKKKEEARTRIKMSEYTSQIALSPVEAEQINLAAIPDGPLNGWGFYTDVTNNTKKDVSYLNLRLSYMGDDGRVVDTREWPAVARHLPGYMPMPDGFDQPMKPGETRHWEWTTGDMPAGWNKKVTIKPIEIRFAAEDKE